jgi:PAS domain S-box-containing protein
MTRRSRSAAPAKGKTADKDSIKRAPEKASAKPSLSSGQNGISVPARLFFANLPLGATLNQTVRDHTDKTADYRIIDVNPAFESQTGIRRDEVVGHLGSKVFRGNPLPDLNASSTVDKPDRPSGRASVWHVSGRSFSVAGIPLRGNTFAMVFQDRPGPPKSDPTHARLLRREAFFTRHFQGIAYQATLDAHGAYRIRLFEGDVHAATGYTAADFQKGRAQWKDLILRDQLVSFERFRKRLIAKPGITHSLEYAIRHRNGTVKWVVDHAQAVRSGRTLILQGAVHDITEHKHAEARVRHLNTVLSSIRNVNQVITREKRMDRLLQKACDLLTENRGYLHAWIVLLDSGRNPTAFFESRAGRGLSPLGAAIQRGVIPAPVRKILRRKWPAVSVHAGRRGKASAPDSPGEFCAPLRHGERILGVMGAAVPATIVSDPEEHLLFREVSGDIGFALHSMAVEERRYKAEALLAEREQMLSLIYDNAFDGISIYEEFPEENRRRLIDCNDRYCEIGGYSKEALLRMGDTQPVQRSQKKIYTARTEFIRDVKNQKVYQGWFSWIRPDGKDNFVEYVAVLVEKEGRQFVVGIDRDVTEQRLVEKTLEASLREKEVLLKEVHHRVKNNLQIIISLLNLQAEHVDDKKIAGAFNESKNRIYTMALVHESLYGSNDLVNIQFDEYVHRMVKNLLRSFAIGLPVELDFDLDSVLLNVDRAIPCALILNEITTNSLKHAFPDDRRRRIGVSLKCSGDGWVTLRVRDNGIGLAEHITVEEAQSMGLTLIRVLVAQLGGNVHVERGEGTCFEIRFQC